MLITRDNYEVYFIDYLDGNLNQSEVDALLLFLDQNPDLANEMEGLQGITLELSNIHFEHKENLKKSAFEKNGITAEFDYLCIAEVENDITGTERKNLDILLEDLPSKKTERELFSKTKLIPDQAIVFSQKASLKRTPIIFLRQSTFRNAMSMAAGLLLLFGLFTIYNSMDSTVEELVAVIEPVKEKNITVTGDAEEIEKEIIEEKSNEPILARKPIRTQKTTSLPMLAENSEPEQFKETVEQSSVIPIQTIGIKSIEVDQKLYAELSLPRIEPSFTKTESELLASADYNQKPPIGRSRTIDFFDIVQMGVQKIANATGSNMQLSAEKDPNGRLTKIQFDSNLFALSTPVRKK